MLGSISVEVKLDVHTATKLNLYAALSHQTTEEAVSAIVKEWMDTIGAARLEHRIDKYVGEISGYRDPIGELENMVQLSERTPVKHVPKLS
jgi:hypothetical protein